jgi:hypothetical protein
MPIFVHDRVLFKDDIGFAVWRDEHWLEHIQFVQLGLTLPIPAFLKDYDLGTWNWKDSVVAAWLNVHQTMHAQLRILTGVGGVDLSLVNLKDQTSWYDWHDDHADEHRQIRTALGLS